MRQPAYHQYWLYPIQVVATDILGLLPAAPLFKKCILVAVSYVMPWHKACAIPNQEASTVAHKLLDMTFLQFPPPALLHSNQGREVELNLIADECKLLGIWKSRATVYLPQGDGLVEWDNSTLLEMFAICTHNHPASLRSHLHKGCFAYNSSEHSTTGYSLALPIISHKMRLPLDLMAGS